MSVKCSIIICNFSIFQTIKLHFHFIFLDVLAIVAIYYIIYYT